MQIKLISLLLILAMLLSFAACQTPVDPVKSGDATNSTPPKETTTADTMDVQTGELYFNAADYIPQEKFYSEEIYVWIDGADRSYDVPEDKYIEGDILQEAVLDRNQKVMDDYDVVLNWDMDWAGCRNQALLRQSILAGDEYDLIGGPATYVNPQIVYGCFFDLTGNEYIDLAQPWWMQKANDTLKIYDKQYTATGYFDLITIKRICVIFFSGPMVTDYRLDDFYDVVDAGE